MQHTLNISLHTPVEAGQSRRFPANMHAMKFRHTPSAPPPPPPGPAFPPQALPSPFRRLRFRRRRFKPRRLAKPTSRLVGLVTNSILLYLLFTIKDWCKKCVFNKCSNQYLRQLFLTVSWDLCA